MTVYVFHPLDYELFIFDADMTLRSAPPRGCPYTDDEWSLMPNVQERLALYDWSRHGFGIVSNQTHIAMGHITQGMSQKLLNDLAVAATGRWWPSAVLRLCPHGYGVGCLCRKPQPFLLQAIRHYWADRCAWDGSSRGAAPKALFVGDMETDKQAAQAAGIDFLWAWQFFGWEEPSAVRDQG